MAKDYKKAGGSLEVTDTVIVKKSFDLKILRIIKQELIDKIQSLNDEKDEIQTLIDKAIELKIKED